MLRPQVQDSLRPWWWLALAWLLLGALLAAYLWAEHRQVERREHALLAQQAGVLHDNLAPQLDAINHVLASLLADAQAAHGPAGGGERLNERLDGRLRNFTDAMPAVRSFNLIDAQGRVLASSAPGLVGRDLHARQYFQAAAQSGDAGSLIVGQPVTGALGDWVLVLGRIVPGRDGGFGGMVTASLDVQHFQTLLRSVRYAPDVLAGLTHGDGMRFLAMGSQAQQAGADMAQPDTAFTRHRAGGQPASVRDGPVRPGGPRFLAALRTVQPAALRMDRPLVAGVGRAWSQVFAGWRAQARTLGLAWLLLGLAAAAGLLLQQRRQRQLSAQAQSLAAEQERHREMLRRLTESLPGMLYQYQLEPDGRSHFPYVSSHVAAAYGYQPQELRADAAPAFAHIHPQDAQAFAHSIQESARTLADWQCEYRVTLPGRGERWLSGQARPQRLEGGAVLWHGYVHDITDLKQQALQLHGTERVLQQLMNDMPVGLCMVDAHRRIYFRNRRFLQDFGHAEAEAPTLHEWSLQAYPDPAYREQVASLWRDAVAQAMQGDGQIPEHDYRITAHDGAQRVVAIGGLVFGEHFLATFQDRTEQQAQREALHRLAYVDSLTGIANRRHFDQQLHGEWRRCLRSRRPLALVLLDIDYFKQFNDLYGHPRGDACLRVVAGELRSRLGRSHDLVARYGGEEFVCLLPECDLEGASKIARVLCRAVRALGIVHAGSAVADVVTISVGVASQVPDAAGSPEALLASADACLYRAKQQGRNRVDDGTVPLLQAPG